MRFQNTGNPPPPFETRDRKLVFLFLGALGVFFAVRVGMQPEFWKAIRGEAAQETAAKRSEEKTRDESVLRDDENLLVTESAASDSGTGFSPAIVHDTIERGEGATLSIPGEVLRPVRDNTLGVRAAEIPAYYATLDFVRQHDAKEMKTAARQVPYTMLMAEPEAHRGSLITLNGRLRRMVPIPASENRFGITQLYDAWVFTSDSGSNPVRVVCTGVPGGIKPAEIYTENPPEVSLYGYFFKTQGYESVGDGSRAATLHTAPLVLAGTLDLIPVVQTQTRDIAAEMIPWLWGFAIAVATLLALVLRNFAASDWTFRHTRAHGLLQPEQHVDFTEVDSRTTAEMLSDLSGSRS